MRKKDFFPFHNKKGHHIDECIEFHQKVARMLTLGKLRIEVMEDNGRITITDKCRIQSTTNGLSKLVLTKPSYKKKTDYRAMPNKYGFILNVETPLTLFQTEISELT